MVLDNLSAAGTIIHRPSLRSRPTAWFFREIAARTVDPKKLLVTTLDYNRPSFYATPRGRVATNSTTCSCSFCLDHEEFDEAPEFQIPTIATVEATVNAKIFFENHFNELLHGENPRALRRQTFEAKLQHLTVSPGTKDKLRDEFNRQETDWLREERVLKTRALKWRNLKGPSIGGYEVVKILGKGAFGVVKLVKDALPSSPDKITSSRFGSPLKLSQIKASAKQLVSRKSDIKPIKQDLYAMKVVRKGKVLREHMEGNARMERDLLVAAATSGSRWIVPLIATFQDKHNLYLVMEYCNGGDFMKIMSMTNCIMPEKVTRFYIAEMVLAIEEAHRMKWIHRDVKPENFLVTAAGHIKLSDFGLSFDGHWAHDQEYINTYRETLMDKLGINLQGDEQDRKQARRPGAKRVTGKKNSIDIGPGDEKILDWRNRVQNRRFAQSGCGTSQYMAPEVIRGEPYDGRCDWWSIGCIIFECLYGETPFLGENGLRTRINVVNHEETFGFPRFREVSDDVCDIIMGLLSEKETRLCTRKYNLNDYPAIPRQQGRHLGRANAGMSPEKQFRDYMGYFVYPDDAVEIKTHPWFRGINWSQLHLQTPPFLPEIRDPEHDLPSTPEVSDHPDDSETVTEESIISEKENQSPSTEDLPFEMAEEQFEEVPVDRYDPFDPENRLLTPPTN